ncbi:ribonuclease HI family protein [Nocardioides sp.]|uniref:ribonuclease HI family protein n=1 Tax=Nocardioides sp. TaxID=35761 RepID=UPI002ED3FBA9
MTLIAAADGSALGNPGPAGWAWYVDEDRWASGGWAHGTNNMGELTAVLDLLQQTADLDDDLLVICDSTYAIKAIREWMPGWKRRGWKKRDGKPVANVEILKELDTAMDGRRDRVHFEWVKGHAGHELNEKADALANAAAYACKEGREPEPGPGMGGGRSAHAFEVTREPEPDPDLFSLAEDVPATDEERIVALERSLLTDEVRGDPAAVAALLHPDWQEVGRSGRLWSREEILAEIGPLPTRVELEVVRVDRVAPDTVLLLWRGIAASGESTLRSSWWVRERGSWRQRYHQGTAEA